MKVKQSKNFPKGIYYFMLIFVATVWGIDPIVNRYLYRYYSATALSALSTFLSALTFCLFSIKKRKRFNMDYVKIALPISILNSLACLLQRIGLQYTSPARYSFLEQLSCIVVPIVLFVKFKRKPTSLQWIASILCLCGCILLTGVGSEIGSLGIGEVLCATAGILFGICIVATGVYGRKLDIGLFMMIHMLVYFLTSVFLAIGLHVIAPNGQSMEKFVFSFELTPLLAGILFGFLSVGLCWLLRTEATKHVHPSAVAAITPMAAVISGGLSLFLGWERFSPSFGISSGMIIGAIVLAAISDAREANRQTVE